MTIDTRSPFGSGSRVKSIFESIAYICPLDALHHLGGNDFFCDVIAVHTTLLACRDSGNGTRRGIAFAAKHRPRYGLPAKASSNNFSSVLFVPRIRSITAFAHSKYSL